METIKTYGEKICLNLNPKQKTKEPKQEHKC